jgi:alkylation response protein AidB-like acyl-CoA dehydrogenase
MAEPWPLRTHSSSPASSFSAAKIAAGEAALKNARACIQVYGGMGYTWEIPAHYYLKRCWVLDAAFGSTDDHADAIAAQLDADQRDRG